MNAGLLVGLLATFGCRDPEHGQSEPKASDAEVLPAAREPMDLAGHALDPLASPEAMYTVLLFVSTECPISNRYAPTIRGLYEQYQARGMALYLVYPDPEDDADAIREHMSSFSLPGIPVRDPHHQLVARAKATVTPEAAIFEAQGKRMQLVYHGRIDDRVRDFGKIAPQASRSDLARSLDALIAGDPVPTPETTAVGCYIVDLE